MFAKHTSESGGSTAATCKTICYLACDVYQLIETYGNTVKGDMSNL